MSQPCLRRARRGFAQAGLKLRHRTIHSASVRDWHFDDYDPASREEGRDEQLTQKDLESGLRGGIFAETFFPVSDSVF